MPRKVYGKKVSIRRKKAVKKSTGRRRLQPALRGPEVVDMTARNARRAYKQKTRAQSNFRARLNASDNIMSAPAFKVGVPKKMSFGERVDMLTNPPTIFKRQYAWSAECESGRKGWFGIPLNKLTTSGLTYGDLYSDAIDVAQRLTTETNTIDPTISFNQTTGQRVYVKYQSDKLRLVNSSSNSLTGKVTLYRYKRDCKASFANVNVPCTPINMMMYASGQNLVGYSAQSEGTVGNGWKFDGLTAGVNYLGNYDMPGSSVNTGGATAQTDSSLEIFTSHVKEHTSYYFTAVKSFSFSLKPGQQINHFTIFNNLPNIFRQAVDMAYLEQLSHYLVVEFQAGIVGDSTANNSISTGSGQLSCILEEKRILGLRGRSDGGKVIMPTPPLAGISKSLQQIINPDTGIADVGVDDDA